ncbi:chloride channel protein [Chelatococcus asaccharovorans]|uniref:chloride channel protein n=1 Tax=Chelatococcus asaccharovorans TaxID=28210 RepID=UPI00224C672E|nr:chloride channel protein [Chelatococcus asaccharovorans]CAH1662525.1 H+/Cl-antiporter ClcA [Chelatococcus asaccharovorans]CAH1683147.1 H+/Cl-antiporter ClcA [Chelatococcus asaccharovorans]
MLKPRRTGRAKLWRRSRVVWGNAAQWKPRLVFWLGAISIGIFGVFFAKAADFAQAIFHAIRGSGEWGYLIPLALTPVGYLVCAYLTLRIAPNAQGSGIPQAMAAQNIVTQAGRARLLSLRIAVVKVVMTIVGLGCGASIGREGPTVQVGAYIMQLSARWGGVGNARGLILAGSAAGIAAAFNTPLAGIVFAIEEMSRSYESRANGLVLNAVILSGLAALALVGNYTYFGETHEVMLQAHDWLLVIACGVAGGFLGAAFSLAVLRGTLRLKRWAQPQKMLRLVLAAGVCGFLVAILGVVSDGNAFGSGYEQARHAIEGQPAPPLYFLSKLLATFLSMMSGIPGGIFAPSLSVGAGLGSSIALLLGSKVGLGALFGMAGYFAGVVQSPMTAFVIILEMTESSDNILALMTASVLGYVTSRLICPEPLYHGLARNFLAEDLRATRAEDRAPANASASASDAVATAPER